MAFDSADENLREIARLRKRKALTQGLFFGSIAFIPLSCLGGCGLAMLIPHDTTRAVFGMIGLLAPFVGLGGMILMGGDRGRYGRSLELALLADEWELAYTEEPTRNQRGVIQQFQVFHDPTNDFSRNFLEGVYEDTEVVVMDYNCSWGRGKWSYVITQTAIVFPDALPDAPDLILYPKSLFDKLAQAVGLDSRPIRIPGEEQLNKTYSLYCKNGKAAAALFTEDIAELCLEEKRLVLEVWRGSLLVYWTETYIKPSELEERLATALRLTRLLQGEK